MSALVAEHGTPLVVYCEETIRAQARAYREAAPGALVVYGTKAFANVALLRLLAEEGVGADVSTLGELAFARAAGIPGERIVFHGNNKSPDELRAAAEADALVVLDGRWEVDVAAEAGVRRVLVRLTPGVDAVTHRAIATAHEESKFGLSPEAATASVVGHAREHGLDVEGVHMHVGSQLDAAGRERRRARAAARVPRRPGLDAAHDRRRRRPRSPPQPRRAPAERRGVPRARSSRSCRSGVRLISSRAARSSGAPE